MLRAYSVYIYVCLFDVFPFGVFDLRLGFVAALRLGGVVGRRRYGAVGGDFFEADVFADVRVDFFLLGLLFRLLRSAGAGAAAVEEVVHLLLSFALIATNVPLQP